MDTPGCFNRTHDSSWSFGREWSSIFQHTAAVREVWTLHILVHDLQMHRLDIVLQLDEDLAEVYCTLPVAAHSQPCWMSFCTVGFC